MNRLRLAFAPRPLAAPPLMALWAFGLTAWSPAAHAGATYGAIGFPGVMGGYAHTVDDKVVLRADYAGLRSRSKDGEHEGIVYKGRVKFARLGLFADYFPVGNGLRLTGGLTLNHMSVDLKSDFHGGTVEVGGTSVPVTSADYFNVKARMPHVTPYVGLGWGHHGQAPGWGFFADLGVSVGKPRVTVDTNLDERGVPQADIDREMQELRDSADKIRVIPQVSFGLSYRY